MNLHILFFLLFLSCFCHANPNNSYTSMFSFGNSYDTGNYDMMSQSGVNKQSFGEINRPTGRCSDGKLIVDFIAENLGIPLLPAYLSRSGNFRRGANFAVSLATTTETAFFEKNKLITAPLMNSNLDVQIGWFNELKPSLCKTQKECKDFFASSLFLFGEFGANDYILILTGGKSLNQVLAYVPEVIAKISSSIEQVIIQGAVNIAVSGQLPTGCVPLFLNLFASPHKCDYDQETGCLKNFNYLASFHNALLQKSLEKLRTKYQYVTISYTDYYKPILNLIKSPELYGFTKTPLSVCRGQGSKSNWKFSQSCGMPDSSSCRNPSSYIYWDGVHLTESAYRYISAGWLDGRFADPPIQHKKK